MKIPPKKTNGVTRPLTVPEAAIASGLSKTTIYVEIKAGRLKSMMRCGKRLIYPADLEAFLRGEPSSVAPKHTSEAFFDYDRSPGPAIPMPDLAQKHLKPEHTRLQRVDKVSSEDETPLDAEASRPLAVIMPDGERTFCTKQVAEWSGKRPSDVMRDVRKILEKLQNGGGRRFALASLEGFYIDKQGKKRACYWLPFDLWMNVTASYDPVVRQKLIEMAFPKGDPVVTPSTNLVDLDDPESVKRSLFDRNQKLIEARIEVDRQEAVIEIIEPLAKIADRLVKGDENICITAAMKKIGWKGKKEADFFTALHDDGLVRWLDKRWMPSKRAIDDGLLVLADWVNTWKDKITGEEKTMVGQCTKVTPFGVQALTDALINWEDGAQSFNTKKGQKGANIIRGAFDA